MIWSERYFAASWQAFLDLFNSIPLIAVGYVAGRILRMPYLQLLFASMGLHFAFDLPLHHDDGRRHFYPLWD